jgi:hypothetical protein
MTPKAKPVPVEKSPDVDEPMASAPHDETQPDATAASIGAQASDVQESQATPAAALIDGTTVEVTIKVPLARVRRNKPHGYSADAIRWIDVDLTDRRREQALRFLHNALDDCGASLGKQPVVHRADAALWLLDRIADAFDEASQAQGQ